MYNFRLHLGTTIFNITSIFLFQNYKFIFFKLVMNNLNYLIMMQNVSATSGCELAETCEPRDAVIHHNICNAHSMRINFVQYHR